MSEAASDSQKKTAKTALHRNLGRRQDTQNQHHNAKRYTSFVAIMKFALAAIALLLIGLVILLPSLEKEEDAITLEFKKENSKSNETRMNNPRFVSSDDGNQQYVVTADTAIQKDIKSKKVDLINLQADIALRTGQWISMSAPFGKLDPDEGFLDLSGGIDIFSDDGNQLKAESAHVDLNKKTIESREGLKGHGPLGEFKADRVVAQQLKGTIRFEGNVKMVLYP